jgi:CubicO group peptidase (beta-lactamase class C family)
MSDAYLDETRMDAPSAGLSPSRLARIEAAMQAEIAAARLPGAVIAVARRGHLAYLGAFGTRDPATGAAMTPDAVFSIASMTKPMTSVAVMQLFEKGQVLLGDPISAYLPAFADLKLGAIAPDGGLTRTPLARRPTVQDLLRHTSGLTYQNRGQTVMHLAYPGSSTSAALSLTRAQAIEALAACPLLFEPGSSWEYGFSTDVLGFIVEEFTGQSLGAYMAENIWSPLGMADTAFDLTDASRARYARPLPNDPITCAPQTLYHERDAEKHWESGGGGAVSTAMDYLRFAEALRSAGTPAGHDLLGPRTVRLMTSDHLPEAGAARIADTMDPAAEGYGFGLGFAVRRADGISAMSGTRGDYYWSGVFGTYFWIDPAEEMSCVVMAAAPGEMRLRYRQLVRALVYQAVET